LCRRPAMVTARVHRRSHEDYEGLRWRSAPTQFRRRSQSTSAKEVIVAFRHSYLRLGAERLSDTNKATDTSERGRARRRVRLELSSVSQRIEGRVVGSSETNGLCPRRQSHMTSGVAIACRSTTLSGIRPNRPASGRRVPVLDVATASGASGRARTYRPIEQPPRTALELTSLPCAKTVTIKVPPPQLRSSNDPSGRYE